MSKEGIVRENWASNFVLIGKAKITDYTFKLNEKSDKNWIYSVMKLGVDCGEKNGTIFTEMMGGYSGNGNSIIYAHGIKEDNTDDYSSRIDISWNERFNEDILSAVGKGCFVNVGLEKDENGKINYKRFLSSYDAIEYLNENLKNEQIVLIRGNIKYSLYNGKVQVKKNITSISAYDCEPSQFKAEFKQSILLNKDSIGESSVDKSKNLLYVDAYVLDYVKEINGNTIQGQYPMLLQFEYDLNTLPKDKINSAVNKLFNIKKNYTQTTFIGKFVNGGNTVLPTRDDLTEDILDLIEKGVYSEEEALKLCSTSSGGNKERLVLLKPCIKMVGDEDKKLPVLQTFPNEYTDKEIDDLLDLGKANDTEEKTKESEIVSGDDLSWLDSEDLTI